VQQQQQQQENSAGRDNEVSLRVDRKHVFVFIYRA